MRFIVFLCALTCAAGCGDDAKGPTQTAPPFPEKAPVKTMPGKKVGPGMSRAPAPEVVSREGA